MRRINKASLERYFLASSAFSVTMKKERESILGGNWVHSVHIVVLFLFIVVAVGFWGDIVHIVVQSRLGSQLLLR
jgi:hypothetical protein